MTREEKYLVLRDLCARLPYSPICHIIGESGAEIDDKLTMSTIDHLDEWVVKPYLRPLSSMTEEEKEELQELTAADEITCGGIGYWGLLSECFGMMYSDYAEIIDWLLAYHFDFRGLIDKGLAISTEEFNPYKD